MKTKTIEHNGIQYVLERSKEPMAMWQIYRVTADGRDHLGADYYQNDIIDGIKRGRFERRKAMSDFAKDLPEVK